ncbi:Phosphatidylinositol 4,5-bisphosphate-binding protein SLM1 [Colletotrichum sp. SAR 10_99]|nr:Phosphatidylinositol 4,5-bisphosphate-binding protein SLM1 [Colletotrichum sp. SAR 10_96]KAI8260758.1 Phosphatidylinositol 4,5-bisphosphate-binding protein SLM1 [Colletotrichum sp. SAR 10_98]KAJ5007858.1 Phosphatidylinositol 4,5-bisphosphate-binding protein SLM1 [Colletotrichum sp. SAR 10_99]
MPRSNSFVSNAGEDHLSLPSRHNTLKKKNSLRRNGSLKRSGSRRSMKAGSVRSLALQSTSDPDEAHSAFHCPVPTSGNPTEALSNRFQSWRKILKDLIAYYREIQTHYEHKSKSLLKLANVANNISTPPGFLESGGIDDALQILRTYHKGAILESNKAKEIEEDVILALTGLRSDLHQKIKEIKNLSGDFKNSSDLDPSLTTGKQDPYLLRLAVDRQVERQIDEENYLHQAYLNLENSGRELESIVVGEIQKAYNAYAGILKRESDAAYSAIDELRVGPITMPKDHEWAYFVQKDDQFVDPNIPIRSAEHIHYPGRDHVACQEIRAGLLERKSKYLKSYTAGCVSSGFDNWDRDAAAQASALPGGMLGTVHPNGYGGTARTPMEETPSNAALVSQQAKEDGVNPYTNEPLRRSQSLHKDSQAAYLYATGMQRAHSQQAAPTRPEEDVQRTSSIDHDRGLETPGGNSQYGQWMNGNAKSSQATSSTDNQRQDASDYSVSAKPGNDDINVAAAAAGTSASRGLNDLHTQQSGEYPKGGSTAVDARH